MSAVVALLRLAQDRGVDVSLSAGEIKLAGRRGDVAALLDPLREHRDELLHWLQSESEVSPERNDSAENNWREIAAKYYLHHIACATCIAASQTRGVRCRTGSVLWGDYLATEIASETSRR